jgi:hypothetical protein
METAVEGQEVGHVAEMPREVVLGVHEELALAGVVYWARLVCFPGPYFAPIAHLGWESGMAPRLRAAAGRGLAGFVLVDGARWLSQECQFLPARPCGTAVPNPHAFGTSAIALPREGRSRPLQWSAWRYS